MGGFCSKNSNPKHSGNLYAKVDSTHQYHTDLDANVLDKSSELKESMENQSQLLDEAFSDDDFYDGIPRYPSLKSRSLRARHSAVARVSEVSSRLGRAGSAGLGKAVEVLDTLGSSMTNLNANTGFGSNVANKGNELAILSFEVANTIVKGSNLMNSLSERRMRHLKEVVLPSEGVQNLISNDMDELLNIVAADKREEMKVFSAEVVRFGTRCKDSQWHSLDRYFEKISRNLTPRKQLKEEAKSVIELLMTFVQYTAELYHEMQVMDRFGQEYQRKCQEMGNAVSSQKGDSLAKLRLELKNQKKRVRNLKKKSLWSRSLEEVMEKLVDIVHFLLLEIHDIFGKADTDVASKMSVNNHKRLGPAGLSLHYANIIMQIDTLVARSSSMPPNIRATLYQNLPPIVKSALRSKLRSFHVKEELTIVEIKDEMEKTLQWLVPMSTNTAKAHHGFGWVGEWATGCELNRKSSVANPSDIMRIETLHHANREKTEGYILELVLWLHHLANKSKNGATAGANNSPIEKSPICVPPEKLNETPLSTEEQEMLQDLRMNKRMPGISKSQDFDSGKPRLEKHDRLSKSGNYSPTRESKDSTLVKRLPTVVPMVALGFDKDKALDMIDRVHTSQKLIY